MNFQLRGIHHVALHVRDYDRTLALYQALGLQMILHFGEGSGRGCLLQLPDGACLEIFADGQGVPPQSGWAHLALHVSDCDAAYAAALAAGARAKQEPRDSLIPGVERHLPVRFAFVYGPDDEEIEFMENKV